MQKKEKLMHMHARNKAVNKKEAAKIWSTLSFPRFKDQNSLPHHQKTKNRLNIPPKLPHQPEVTKKKQRKNDTSSSDVAFITQNQLKNLLNDVDLLIEKDSVECIQTNEEEVIPEQQTPCVETEQEEKRDNSPKETITKEVQEVTSTNRAFSHEVVSSQKPRAAMSLLEQKKLQWAKEKAQMAAEWNPWGRPGCGAPLVMGSESRKPSLDWSSTIKSHLNSPDSSKVNGDTGRLLPPLPHTTPSPKNIAGVLPNFASSLTFGVTEPSDNKIFTGENEDDKSKISLDLVNNNQEVMKSRSSSINGHHSPINVLPAFASAVPIASDGFPALECTETVTIQRSFLRGANVPLDPDARAELELKRRKQREQQLAIQAQLEEKQRRLREERERIKQEDAKEDEKLQLMNQRLLQLQAVEEDNRLKKFSASSKRGSVVSQLNVNEDLTQTNHVQTSIPVQSSQERAANETAADAEVSIASKPETKEENVLAVKVPQTPISNVHVSRVVSPYIVNRLLTPTKYRGSENYLPRDCGTQTDSSLFSKKDVGIDTVEEEKTSKKKSEGKNVKKRQEKENEIKPRPKWGAHQSDKTYQRQSEKGASYRRLEEMRQKRLKEEALIQIGQPQVGNGRTRSSARHQRYLLVRETTSPPDATHSYSFNRSASPHLLRHQSSTESATAYDSNTEGSTRRQRKQWDSPRGDELPNFYTQPLAGRRNSRSQSSHSTETDTPDTRLPYTVRRDISPSAPGISSWNSAFDIHHHPQPMLRNRVHNSLENVQMLSHNEQRIQAMNEISRRNNAWTSQTLPIDGYSADRLDFVPYARSSVFLGDGITRSAPLKQNRILQQLSAIRKGLLMKQQQMEQFINAGREFTIPDKDL